MGTGVGVVAYEPAVRRLGSAHAGMPLPPRGGYQRVGGQCVRHRPGAIQFLRDAQLRFARARSRDPAACPERHDHQQHRQRHQHYREQQHRVQRRAEFPVNIAAERAPDPDVATPPADRRDRCAHHRRTARCLRPRARPSAHGFRADRRATRAALYAAERCACLPATARGQRLGGRERPEDAQADHGKNALTDERAARFCTCETRQAAATRRHPDRPRAACAACANRAARRSRRRADRAPGSHPARRHSRHDFPDDSAGAQAPA